MVLLGLILMVQNQRNNYGTNKLNTSNYINSFDIAYCLVVNLLTYILISSITTIIHNQITRVWKRVILCISIVIVSIAYINFGSIDIRVLINSIILAPISWSWVFKPIAKRMNWDYKDFDNKLNN